MHKIIRPLSIRRREIEKKLEEEKHNNRVSGHIGV